VAGVTSPYPITGLTDGTTYYVVLTAVNAGGESPPSGQASATPQVAAPAAPIGLSATPGDGQLTATWSTVATATSYNLYYSTTFGAGTSGTKVAGVTSPATITGLTDGFTYYLVVTAVNGGGESPPSAQAFATPQAAPLAPSIVSATSFTPTGANVQWNAPLTGPSPTTYTIYYGNTNPVTAANSAGSAAVRAASSVANSAWVWGLAPTTQYYFAVSGSVGSAESPLSATLGALTTAPMHAIAIAAEQESTVALKADGSVWTWGAPWLGNNTPDQSDVPVQVCATSSNPGVCDTALSGVAAISGESGSTLALKTDGSVWGWGDQFYGQLGNNPTDTDRRDNYAGLPVQVCGSGTAYSGSCGTSPQYLTGMSAIAAGWYHSVALSSDGTVWAWGDDEYGQLGDGTTGDSLHNLRMLPVHVLKGASSGDTAYLGDNASAPVVAIGASAGSTFALKSDGTVWTWGSNDAGELGAGLAMTTSTQVTTPVQVLKGACASDATYLGDTVKVVAISVGSDHVLALKADGTLWSWGDNSNGQLGNNNRTVNSNVPVQVCATSTSAGVCDTALTGVTAFGAGTWDSYGATSAGTYAWGFNHYGTLLGDSSTSDSGLPVKVPLIGSATAMTSGAYHSVALQSDHTVWTWGGNNQWGQLGIGGHDPNSASPPTYPPAMR